MLLNGNFESGFYSWKDDRYPEGTWQHAPDNIHIPQGWEFWHADPTDPKKPPQDQDWGRPEAVVWLNDNFGPDFEHADRWRDGKYTFKVFGAFRPIWWRLHQNVSGLTPGVSYRFVVPIYMDLVSSYNPTVLAQDPNSGVARLRAGKEEGAWYDGRGLPFGQWNVLSLDFRAHSAQERVHIEAYGRWGLVNNAFFVDGVTLTAISDFEQSPPQVTGSGHDILDRMEKDIAELRKLL